jgi:acetate kinase
VRILCLNAGSSSLKAALFTIPDGSPADETLPSADVRVLVERVGGTDPAVTVWAGDAAADTHPVGASDHVHALDAVTDATVGSGPVDVVAHRVVHGGPNVLDHTVVDDRVLAELRAAEPFAPLHLPAELALLAATTDRYGGMPQVVCLDTAFHRHLLAESRRLPVPADLDAAGVRRYGFHGLSYEHLVHRLGPRLGTRAVLAHLGNGASAAAVLDGVGIDTTMGLTPTGGLVMGSRTGDIDPGVLLHAMRTRGLDADGLERLVDRESGLVGLTGRSGDVRDLLAARAAGDPSAALAFDVYTSVAAKHIAGLVTVLGGIDTLVFTGGVGEHAGPVRAAIVGRLAPLGVAIDPAANEADRPVANPAGSPVTVRVEPTDEEATMARHAVALVGR